MKTLKNQYSSMAYFNIGYRPVINQIPESKYRTKIETLKIVTVAVLPIITLVVQSSIKLQSDVSDLVARRRVKMDILFSKEVNMFIKYIQLERDLTVLYLGSGGDGKIHKNLTVTYRHSDQAIFNLSRWPHTDEEPSHFISRDYFFENNIKFRETVHTNNSTIVEVLRYYSEDIDVVIEWLTNSFQENSGVVWKSLVGYHFLILSLEKSAIERALGSLVLIKEMSRNSKKIYQTYSAEDFDKAIEAVQSGSMSQRRASKVYGIPQPTLSDKLRGRTDGSKPGRKPVIPVKVEMSVAKKCSDAASMGLGIPKVQLMQKVGRLAKEMKMKTPFRKGIPGKDWWYGFKKRNPDITLRVPEKLTSVRSRGLNPTQVGNYMRDLKTILHNLALEKQPECIWNMDEKGVSMEHKPVKVVASKMSRTTPGRCSNTREQNTIIACINAAGAAMPPMIIVKGKTEKSLYNYNTSDGPVGSKWSYQQNAWTEDVLGVEWFKNVFLENCGPKRPQLLIMDGHHSHEVLGLIEKAVENHVHILVLPAHTTHYLCPLDRTVFGPFSYRYNAICTNYLENPSQIINKVTWPKLFAEAYNESFNPENIKSGFRACGIVPWDPLAIPRDAFLPSVAYDVGINSNMLSKHPLKWCLSCFSGERVESVPSASVVSNSKFSLASSTSLSSCVIAGTVPRHPHDDDQTLQAPKESAQSPFTSVATLAVSVPSTATVSVPSVADNFNDSFSTLISNEPENVFLRDSDPFLLLPTVDEETRTAVETLVSLDNSGEGIEPLSVTDDITPLMTDWNTAVNSMFQVHTKPVSKKTKTKRTAHRLLTSNDIIMEKKKVEEEKKIKEAKKESRQKIKELTAAKKQLEMQIKALKRN